MRGLRAFVFHGYLVASTAVIGIAGLPVMLLPRRLAFGPARLWTRLLLAGFERIIGVRVEIRGRERLPEGPFLAASKHQSMWDTLIGVHLFRDPAFVLKRELLSIPLYGWYARKYGMIAIDREAHASALRLMVLQARARLAEGRTVVIYPEGTRVAVDETLTYKPGVAALYRQLGVACVPIALTSGLCWPRSGYGYRPGRILLEILEPIPPGLDRAAFMAELESRIESATIRLTAEARGG